MDTPIESVNAADPISQLPTENQPDSFGAALDAAFASLESSSQEPQEVQQVEQKLEPVTQTEAPVSYEEEDLLEQLTEEGDWTPKAANRFKQLKEELKQFRSERDQFKQLTTEQEQKIQELAAIAENRDVEELQAKVAEYEQERMFSNLEQTTAFQNAVTKPLAALVEQVDQIADKYELDSSSLIDILALTDPTQQDERLSELLPNASDRDKAKLYRIIEEVNPILQRRQELFDNVEAASKEAALLEETKNKQELYEKVKLRENITRNVVERITEKLPFVKNISGLDISSIQQKAAQTDPTVIHPVDFAYNAVSAQILPAIVREYNSQKKEIESLTDRLAEYENAEPKISGSSPTRTATGLYSSGNSGAVEGNFIDAINKAFGS